MPHPTRISRRWFLRRLASAGAAGLLAPGFFQALPGSDRLGPTLPLRPLGTTGDRIPAFALGGWHIGAASPATARTLVETALEEGVRLFDTAANYQNGGSERYLGEFLPARFRDELLLLTKSAAPTGVQVRRELEESLRRLRTDRIDYYLIHSISTPEDVDRRLADGVLDTLHQAKEQGLIRHIGFSGHFTSAAHLRLLERVAPETERFACAMIPVNAVDPSSEDSFTANLIDPLLARGTGILAMKTACWGRLMTQVLDIDGRSTGPAIPAYLSKEEAFGFALSLPVSTWVSGVSSVEELRENLSILRRFSRLGDADRLAIVDKVAAFANSTSIEVYRRWG